MNEYKGIYYGNSNEHHFYEGGAHFKYIELYRRLEILYRLQVPIDPIKQVILFYYLYIYIHMLLIMVFLIQIFLNYLLNDYY